MIVKNYNYILFEIKLEYSLNMEDLSDFEIVKKLGSGSFSAVYKVKRKSDH